MRSATSSASRMRALVRFLAGGFSPFSFGTGYTFTGNVAVSNGGPASCFPNAGITLSDESTGDVLTHNDSSQNRGFGIAIRPGTNGNLITNNTARGNTVVDLRGFPGTVNTWLDNNRCNTESGAVPSSVCNTGE